MKKLRAGCIVVRKDYDKPGWGEARWRVIRVWGRQVELFRRNGFDYPIRTVVPTMEVKRP